MFLHEGLCHSVGDNENVIQNPEPYQDPPHFSLLFLDVKWVHGPMKKNHRRQTGPSPCSSFSCSSSPESNASAVPCDSRCPLCCLTLMACNSCYTGERWPADDDQLFICYPHQTRRHCLFIYSSVLSSTLLPLVSSLLLCSFTSTLFCFYVLVSVIHLSDLLSLLSVLSIFWSHSSAISITSELKREVKPTGECSE